MPSLTTTIEDTSPILTYSPPEAWVQGNSSLDSQASNYSGSSFTDTRIPNSSVTFTFQGSSLAIYGAMRGNHGPFTVDVDGTVFSSNGFSSTDLFQVPLFQTNLQQGTHNITLTNGGNNTFVDIDFVTWSSNIGLDSEKLTDFLVEDSDPAFNYKPSPAWSTNVVNIGSFMGGSGHSTSQKNAYVEYTFTGAAVALYGTVGPNNAPYSVQLDGGHMTNYSATKVDFVPQTLLYRADNLGSGSHSLLVQNQQTTPGQVLQIDYAIVYTVPSVSSGSSKLSGGTIAGIVIALLLLLLALTGFVFFLRRRRVRQAALEGGSVSPYENKGTLRSRFGLPAGTFDLSEKLRNATTNPNNEAPRREVATVPAPPAQGMAPSSPIEFVQTRRIVSTDDTPS